MVSLAWCLLVSGRIWFTPIPFSGVEWSTASGQLEFSERVQYRSFSEISGLGVVPLLLPVLLAGWAAWAAWRRRTRALVIATSVFLAFCFLAGFSVGGAYLPAGFGLAAAAWLVIAGRPTQ
jgi:hypothetical protein